MFFGFLVFMILSLTIIFFFCISNAIQILRYNTALETLDLSCNPCCGPTLEGILELRTTCTINNSIKRIFLSQTELGSQGSIAIAEFLPEMKSLIHLDLTENHEIDIAGVMALAVSVKMNTSLRCLDINIPPNDPDFAHLSQDILQSCVRNTELAQQSASQRGTSTVIAQPMLKSTVVKALAHHQSLESTHSKQQIKSATTTKMLRNFHNIDISETIKKNLTSTETTCNVLRDLIYEDEQRKIRLFQEGRKGPIVVECSDLVRELLDQVKAGQIQIKEALDNFGMDETLCTQALSVHAQSLSLSEYAHVVYKEPVNPNLRSPFSSESAVPLLDAPPNDSIDTQISELNIGKPLGEDLKEEQAAIGTEQSSDWTLVNSEKQAIEPTRSHFRPVLRVDHLKKEKDEVTLDVSDHSPTRCTSSSTISSPRSPVESHSRSLTIEEGEVFRKGSVLGTAIGDQDAEIPGEILKESILIAQVERTKRNSMERPEEEEIYEENNSKLLDKNDNIDGTQEDDEEHQHKRGDLLEVSEVSSSRE